MNVIKNLNRLQLGILLIMIFSVGFISCSEGQQNPNNSSQTNKTDQPKNLPPQIFHNNDGSSVYIFYYPNGLIKSYSRNAADANCDSESIFFSKEGHIDQIIVGQSCYFEKDTLSENFNTAIYHQDLFVKCDSGKITEVVTNTTTSL